MHFHNTYQCWFAIYWVNACINNPHQQWYQSTYPRPLNPKPKGFKILPLVKHWYLVGMSSLCRLKLLYGSIPFSFIMILGRCCLSMKVDTWYIDLNVIKSTNIVKYSYYVGIKKNEILVMVSQKKTKYILIIIYIYKLNK